MVSMVGDTETRHTKCVISASTVKTIYGYFLLRKGIEILRKLRTFSSGKLVNVLIEKYAWLRETQHLDIFKQ